MENLFKNKKILITGAGTIGTGLLKELLKYDVHTIRVLDNNELRLHEIYQLYPNDERIKLIFGDIRDIERLKIAIRGVDIIFHAAAMKHVNFCEFNPIDAVKTNVLGTQNLLDLAISNGVERFVNISTDKATNPIGVLGATKLLSERLVSSSIHYKGKSKIIMYSVRFGNVLGSSGSVITIFEDKLKSGKPIEVRNLDMTRFTMFIEDAINLILGTVEIAKGGEIFILKMPSFKIYDLAVMMIDKFEGSIKMSKVVKGEKIHEKLISDDEVGEALESKELIVICPDNWLEYYKELGFSKLTNMLISSSDPISRDDIKDILKRYYETKD